MAAKLDLAGLFAQVPGGSGDREPALSEWVDWLERVFRWLRDPTVNSEALRQTRRGATPATTRRLARFRLLLRLRIPRRRRLAGFQPVRVRFFLLLLTRNPTWARDFGRALREVIRRTDATDFWGETGLVSEAGLWSELTDRVISRVLPRAGAANDLREAFERLFLHEGDADWLETCPESERAQLLALARDPDARASALLAIDQAMRLLAARLSGVGAGAAVRARLPGRPVVDSPFLVLPRAVEAHLALPHPTPDSLEPALERCRVQVAGITRGLETAGVSVHLVYQLEQLTDGLDRLRLLAHVREDPSGDRAFDALAALVRARIDHHTVSGLLRRNLHLLSRKVVERTGASGEHYIARDRGEWLRTLRSAAGGGALTAVTLLIKTAIQHVRVAPFVEGLLSAANYAGSFLAMQGLHLTLATKQPSMTAAALAAKLSRWQGRGARHEFVHEAFAIARSQSAAAIGNLAAIIPVAILLDVVSRNLFGWHILDTDYAHKSLRSLHPLASLTLVYATLTGALLWVSSLCAGLFENWIVWRRIPRLIAESRFLGRALGAPRAEAVARTVLRQSSAFAGNVSLGVLLAFTPIIGTFFGLPFDVRHVTLSTGSATLAICAIGWSKVSAFQVAWTVAGILAIGALNFGVSFVLAIALALRARSVRPLWTKALGRQAWRQFKRHPLSAIVPPA